MRWRFCSETLIAAAIISSTILLGVSSDVAKGWFGWIMIDVFFALIFVVESSTKLYLSGVRVFFTGSDRVANCVETALAALAVLDTTLAWASRGLDVSGDLTGDAGTSR